MTDPDGHATISSEVLARYAADAACEIEGVSGLVESHVPRHRGVRVLGEEGSIRIELHLAVERGASIPELGHEAQRRVIEYLAKMADVDLEGVDVIVDEIRGAVP